MRSIQKDAFRRISVSMKMLAMQKAINHMQNSEMELMFLLVPYALS